jgi:hypothetical protein
MVILANSVLFLALTAFNNQVLAQIDSKTLFDGVAISSTKSIQEVDRQNRCVYVKKDVSFKDKRWFCCFDSTFAKMTQVQARSQRGIKFEVDGNNSCRGLTMDELKSIDFTKFDYSYLSGKSQWIAPPMTEGSLSIREAPEVSPK